MRILFYRYYNFVDVVWVAFATATFSRGNVRDGLTIILIGNIFSFLGEKAYRR